MIPEAACARDVARQREERGKERIERAIVRVGALARVHVGVAVPEFAADFVGQIFMDRGNARVPHLEAILVAEEEPAFPKIFVIGIDPAR